MSKEVVFRSIRCHSVVAWYKLLRTDTIFALDQFLAPGKPNDQADAIVATRIEVTPTRWATIRAGKKHLEEKHRDPLDRLLTDLRAGVETMVDLTRKELRGRLLTQLNPAVLFRDEAGERELEELLAGVSEAVAELPPELLAGAASEVVVAQGFAVPVLIGTVLRGEEAVVIFHDVPPFAETLGTYLPNGVLTEVKHDFTIATD